MSEYGFIKLPRSLLENSAWYDARPAHQAVFLQILMRCCFKPTIHNFNGNLVELKIGQFAASLDQIQKFCGKHISIGDVRGCIRYFEKCQFLTQSLTHGKTVITLCQPDIYDHIKNTSNTTSNTELTQSSHTKEEREERKEEKSSSARGVFFCRKTKQFVGLTESVMSELVAVHSHITRHDEHIERAARWLITSEKGKSRVGNKGFLNTWLRNANDHELRISQKIVQTYDIEDFKADEDVMRHIREKEFERQKRMALS